jgi:hypothetical protein
MSIDEVRERLNAPPHAFDKGGPVDAFDSLGVHVCYDDDGWCNGIEFYKGDPVFEGMHLLTMSARELERCIMERDPNVLLQLDGFVSLRCGLAASGDPEMNERVKSVLVFPRGYYDGSAAALDTLARPTDRPLSYAEAAALEAEHAAQEVDDDFAVDDAPGWRSEGFYPDDGEFRIVGTSFGVAVELDMEFRETIVVRHDDHVVRIPRAAMIELLRRYEKRAT